MAIRELAAGLALGLLGACAAPGADEDAVYDRLNGQLAPYHPDAEKLDFLVGEAVNAGVRQFKFTQSTREYGRAHTNGIVELSLALRGGTGVINVTHEVSHVAGFRQNCTGHRKCWLDTYLNMARRYEARFPGDRWSGTTPTRRVMRNAQRYGIAM